jgi:hypothetical protein
VKIDWRITDEVKAELAKDPSARVPVILTCEDAGEAAVELRKFFPAASVIYLTGYVFANMVQSEVNIILKKFPNVKVISLNRKVTNA